MRTPKQVILDALSQYMGGDLERAEAAFKNLSEDELNKEYGQSGQTCKEILEEYRERQAEVKNAIMWAITL